MFLTIKNIQTKLSSSTPDERNWIREYLAFENSRSRFIKGFTGDGRIHLFNVASDTFPTGVLALVTEAAIQAGHTVELVDARVQPVQPDPQADLAWLRDYQVKAVDKVVEHKRGILWVPTGGGKTDIFVGLVRKLPCRWLFLVHRMNLAIQAAERLSLRSGMRAGIVGEGRWEDFSQSDGIVCATFQTLAARLRRRDPSALQLLQEAQALIVDEAHTLPADSFLGVTQRTTSAYYRVGLSGTPLARGDRRSVIAIGALGKVIYRIRPDILIAKGVLAKPTIQMVPLHQDSQKPTWQGIYGECIVRSSKRNRLIADIVKKAEKPCLVFVKEIRHGKLLEAALTKSGIKCGFVWGNHSVDWRTSAVKRLLSGDFEALICSTIFQEGIDIPDLRSVVVASAGKSVIATLQRLGRGIRIAANKSTFECWDVMDKGSKILERHSRQRLLAYAGEKYEVKEAPL